MQIDIAVGAIARAEPAADAPILDDDLKRIAAANRADRAADHAEGVATLAATGSYEVAVKAQAVAHQTRDAVMSVGASVHAGIAARAILQVKNEQALCFHQSLREKLVDGDAVDHLQALLVGSTAFGSDGFEAGANAGEACDHIAKIISGNTH